MLLSSLHLSKWLCLLFIRFINQDGRYRSVFISPAASVPSSYGPSLCMVSLEITTLNRARNLSLASQSFSCFWCASIVSQVCPCWIGLQPCFPQCIFILRAWAFMGAKRVTLVVLVPCLLGYIFLLAWFSLQEMLVFKEAFLFLGPRTGCFKAFPRGYNSYSVYLISICVLQPYLY